MENNRQKSVTYAGAIVIALLLIGVVFTSAQISKGKRNLNAEKKISEKLLSEKLSIEKQLAEIRADFSILQLKSDANMNLLAQTNIKIAESEKKINSLSGENRSLRTNRKELEELRKTKANLEKESSKLKSDYEKLIVQNNELHNSLSTLEAEKKNLALQLEKARKGNLDNFLVTATRGRKQKNL